MHVHCTCILPTYNSTLPDLWYCNFMKYLIISCLALKCVTRLVLEWPLFSGLRMNRWQRMLDQSVVCWRFHMWSCGPEEQSGRDKSTSPSTSFQNKSSWIRLTRTWLVTFNGLSSAWCIAVHKVNLCLSVCLFVDTFGDYLPVARMLIYRVVLS